MFNEKLYRFILFPIIPVIYCRWINLFRPSSSPQASKPYKSDIYKAFLLPNCLRGFGMAGIS